MRVIRVEVIVRAVYRVRHERDEPVRAVLLVIPPARDNPRNLCNSIGIARLLYRPGHQRTFPYRLVCILRVHAGRAVKDQMLYSVALGRLEAIVLNGEVHMKEIGPEVFVGLNAAGKPRRQKDIFWPAEVEEAVYGTLVGKVEFASAHCNRLRAAVRPELLKYRRAEKAGMAREVYPRPFIHSRTCGY